jgi:hypothetical protein
VIEKDTVALLMKRSPQIICRNCNHPPHPNERCCEPLRGHGYYTDTVCECVDYEPRERNVA